MATNHSDLVKRVDSEFPHLLQHNDAAACGEFIQRVCNEPEMKNERWGLLSKSEGEAGYTFPNGVRCSYDVIALPNGERIDIISGGNGHPAPGGPSWGVIPPHEWRPNNVYTDISSWPLFDSGTSGGEGSNKVSLLGRGWFCFMRALQDWKPEALENWNWILTNENPDIFRVMLNVEGFMHQGGHAEEPWAYAGVDPNASWWKDKFHQMLDIMGESNKKAWLTLHGGKHYLPSDNDRLRFNDQVVNALNEGNRWGSVFGFEIANEYNVNGFTDQEVQLLGEHLSQRIPANMWLALSSPHLAHGDPGASNEVMLGSLEQLYGKTGEYHHGANCMTIHRNRDESSRWADPFSYNTLMPELPKMDNEPSGQDASAGGDKSDPAWICGEYNNVSRAGWIFYMAHNAWCVWNGHMPQEYLNELSPGHKNKFIVEMTNQTEISAELKEYRETGEVNVPPAGGGEVMIPYDENKSVEFGTECNKVYEECGKPKDPGMVSVHSSRAAWDYYVGGMTWPDSLKKHVNEFRAVYGLPAV